MLSKNIFYLLSKFVCKIGWKITNFCNFFQKRLQEIIFIDWILIPTYRECKRIKTAWKKPVFIAGFYWFFSKKFWKKPTKVVFFKILTRKKLRMWPNSRISLKAVILTLLKNFTEHSEWYILSSSHQLLVSSYQNYMTSGTISLTIPKLRNMAYGRRPHWLVTTCITTSFPFSKTDLANTHSESDPKD